MQIVTEEEATGRVADIYDEIKTILGSETFVPNFFKALAVDEHWLELTWSLVRKVLCEGVLPRLLKEMMFVRVAELKSCEYCEAAHLAFCAKLGVTANNCSALLQEAPALFRAEYCLLLDYVSAVADRPTCAMEFDRSKVSDAEFYETIQMVALAAYASYLADSMQIPVDSQFHDILGATQK